MHPIALPSKADNPPMFSKPSSRAGSVTPSVKGNEGQDDFRDDVSVAESSKGHRKTEEERLQFFQSQPDCREVEPNRAFCIGCDQWVSLNPARAYVMRPWIVHRRHCHRNSPNHKQYALDSRFSAFCLMYARVGGPRRLPIKKGQLPMAAKVTTTSHLLYHLHPRNWVYSRERRNVRLISKGTRVPKKFDHTKCCARPARNGCSSETRRDIRSVTGRNINNDAPAQCEALVAWTLSFTV